MSKTTCCPSNFLGPFFCSLQMQITLWRFLAAKECSIVKKTTVRKGILALFTGRECPKLGFWGCHCLAGTFLDVYGKAQRQHSTLQTTSDGPVLQNLEESRIFNALSLLETATAVTVVNRYSFTWCVELRINIEVRNEPVKTTGYCSWAINISSYWVRADVMHLSSYHWSSILHSNFIPTAIEKHQCV